jgi:hypothetical protein
MARPSLAVGRGQRCAMKHQGVSPTQRDEIVERLAAKPLVRLVVELHLGLPQISQSDERPEANHRDRTRAQCSDARY